MQRRFEPGHTYFAAGEVPFVVSEDMIREDLEDQGFTDVRLWDAEDFGPLPFRVDGDVDTVGMATFAGRSPKTIDVPEEILFVHDLTAPASQGEDVPPLVVLAPRPESKPVERGRWWVYSAGVAGAALGIAALAWAADWSTR